MVNNLKYECINNTSYINLHRGDHLEKAQQKLKEMPNSMLPQEMLKATVRAMTLGKPVVEEVCEIVNKCPDGWISFNDDKGKSAMNKFEYELKFIEDIKSNDDFIEAYMVREEINSIWIIIKDASFQFNKKYLKCAREFKKNNNCEFNIVIFDESQIDEVKEQLKYYDDYEVAYKDAK